MKKILLAWCVFNVISLWAETQQQVIDGYTWSYNLVGYQGSIATIKTVSPKSGDIVVPSILGGVPVETIEASAFYDGSDIRSVVVSDGIITVGANSFSSCTNMEKVVLPATVRDFSYNVFSDCPNLKDITLSGDPVRVLGIDKSGYGMELDEYYFEIFPIALIATNLVVADGSEKINSSCFASWTSLTRVSIPESVTNIGAGAFNSCYSLKAIVIPAGVMEIGANAFGYCINLTEVVFEGDAPIASPILFENSNLDLVVRVPKGSKGWDGNPNSTKLPKLWPSNTSGGRPIMHIGDPLPKPEPLICTNYVFETITNHVYHHDVVTDLTAYHTTVTNVHVHYVNENAKPTFIFPSEYDTGFVNVVAEVEGGYAVIPATWSVNYPGFTEKYGNDFSKALSKHNGKFDQRGNPMYVWQDYVAGTNPMDVNDVFHATIAIEGGQVVVSHSPVLDEARAALRKYTVYGKKNLMDSEWKVVEPGEELDYNFYRVTVRMKQSE